MSRRRAERLAWALVVVWAALIFIESARSGADLDAGSDLVAFVKRVLAQAGTALFGHEVDVSPVGHFAEYLVFGGLLANALRFHVSGARKTTLAATGLACIYAASDELHQLFVPQRSCDPADWAVDMAAALIGSAIVAVAVAKKAGRRDDAPPCD